MAYNYGPPGAYNPHQPAFPPLAGNAPGMGMPPPAAFGAPGMDAAPGMMPSQSPVGLQGQFQPPPNMPNINFNAPVIRLGVADPGKASTPAERILGGGGRGPDGRGSNAEPLGGGRNRLGLGADARGGDRNLDRERAAVRESMMALQPPTREEVARTIFVGGLADGTPDDGAIESLLRCAGKLRRWTRARDADDKKCKFGFAEYEDVESLEAANEIFQDIDVPLLKMGAVLKDDAGEIKKARLLVVVDDQSKTYIEDWKGRRKEDDDARQFRIDGCKEDLRQSLASLTNTGAFAANGTRDDPAADQDGDTKMAEGTNGDLQGDGAEIVTIPLGLEDELSDIPAEMRATVAEEIKSFRDRSVRRDLERLRREEELELAERQRSMAGPRANRLASPPPSGAPSGPASAANGIPVGPRSGVHGAPSGPKGYRGAQMPSDYVNGAAFVSGNGPNGVNLHREDEDAEESDEELERRRHSKRSAELEKQYLEAERKWLQRERTRGAAQQREREREEAEKRAREREKELIAKRLREWNDDEELKALREEYYIDRGSWVRKRGAYRAREDRDDERDRVAEEREAAEERRKQAEARGLADAFLDQTAADLAQSAQSPDPSAGGLAGTFKISLGSAAARTRAAAAAANQAPRRGAMGDVEGLLEDEEDAVTSGTRRLDLKPLTDTSTAPLPLRGQDLSDEQRADARQALAAEIPTTSSSSLLTFPIQWSHLSAAVLDQHVRPFVEKKVVEYLGVQEDLLVDMVIEGLRGRKEARDIVAELEPALEDEADVMVRKVWRMVAFFSESEARGLT